MAKIFKIEGYYVDPNGDWSAEDLQTELEAFEGGLIE